MSGPEPRGARVTLTSSATRSDVVLFNESQSRIVISVESGKAADILAHLEKRGVTASRIGTVTATENLEIATAGKAFTWPLSELLETWSAAIPSLMEE